MRTMTDCRPPGHTSSLLTLSFAGACTQTTPPAGAPNLDVRLTRSQSGSILDIDFVGGAASKRAPMSLAHEDAASLTRVPFLRRAQLWG